MAKPVSFNKRENEKKKASKRLEKQKKKEERKANPGSGLMDDMIAYVDANGAITSTPPSEQLKEEINPEEIEISIPKKEDMEPVVFMGRVEHFNVEKGYGFIKDLSSTEKYFFYITSAPADINEGDKVTFQTEKGTRGMNAINIEKNK